MEFDIKEVQFSNLSLVDEVGKVFMWQGRVFRAINEEAVGQIKEIMSVGLIAELVENNLFPKSWITDYKMEGYGLIIEHERIPRITYPFEWSFSMLKDAAIAVLRTNQIAAKYGYQTKDCHGYNVIFDRGHFKYVDLGSFVKRDISDGWIAYGEFLQCYYYPLRIWKTGNYYLVKRILDSLEFMPHRVFYLYQFCLLRLIDSSWIDKVIALYLKYKNIGFVQAESIKKRLPFVMAEIILYLRKKELLPFQKVDFNELIGKINSLKYSKNVSFWGNYHDQYLDEMGDIKPSKRFLRILDIVNSLNVESSVELGGNQGLFSMLLLAQTKVRDAICTDLDEQAVEAMYLKVKKENMNITPAIINAILPNGGYRLTKPSERLAADAVFVLALTHHLLLSQGISIDSLFFTIARYSKRYVFIEFMPMGLFDGESAPPVPKWYNQEWFKNAFEEYFTIIFEEKLEENRVLFVGEIR